MILASVAAVVGLAACGGKAGAKNAYGKPIPAEMPTTPAGDILSRPQDFDGKDVLVSGKITSECPSGGWIWVKDPTGEIYVNMHPTNVFIPQKVGTTVKTMGRVVLEQGRPQVVGRGLQF
jgi:hypothetical protein